MPGSKDLGRRQRSLVHLDERIRVVFGIARISRDEIFRVLGHPGMVRRHMVRAKIENQADATSGQLAPRDGQSSGASQRLVDNVTAHAVCRSDVVLRLEIG
jgi:hypothetical protein